MWTVRCYWANGELVIEHIYESEVAATLYAARQNRHGFLVQIERPNGSDYTYPVS